MCYVIKINYRCSHLVKTEFLACEPYNRGHQCRMIEQQHQIDVDCPYVWCPWHTAAPPELHLPPPPPLRTVQANSPRNNRGTNHDNNDVNTHTRGTRRATNDANNYVVSDDNDDLSSLSSCPLTDSPPIESKSPRRTPTRRVLRSAKRQRRARR